MDDPAPRSDDERLQLAEHGLQQAFDRFMAARVERDEFAVFYPLVEALMWVVAVDDWHRDRFRAGLSGTGGPRYRDVRDALEPTCSVAAIRWCRNLAIHDLVQLLEVDTSGARYTTHYPKVYHELCWRTVEDLPELSEKARADDYGHAAFLGYVEEPARLTLATARDFLTDGVWAAHDRLR